MAGEQSRNNSLHRIFVLVLCVGIAVELLLVTWLQRPWVQSDSKLYLELADSLSQGDFLSQTDYGPEPEAMRSPGYPLFLAVFTRFLSLPIIAVVLVQMAVYAATIFLIYRHLFADRVRKDVFLLAAAVYIFPMFYCAAVIAEALSGFLLTAATVMLVLDRRGRLGTNIAVGLLIGIGTLLRPEFVLMIATLTFVAFCRQVRLRRSWRTVVASSLALPIAALAVLSPFAIRNLATFHRFAVTPVVSPLGLSLYAATWEHYLPYVDRGPLTQGPITPRAISSGLAAEATGVQRRGYADGLRSPGFLREYPARAEQAGYYREAGHVALNRIRADPGSFALHTLGGFWRLWHTSVYPASVPRGAEILLRAISIATVLLSIVGIGVALFLPGTGGVSRIPGVVILSTLLLHAPLHTEARYTAPVRLLMLAYAVAGSVWLVRRVFAQRSEEALDISFAARS